MEVAASRISQSIGSMECEIPRRPHTVGGSMPKVSVQPDFIAQLLQEIENEARGPISKPKPPQKNHMKENLKRLKDIQAQAKQKISEKQPLQPLRVPNKYCEVQSKISKTVYPSKERTLLPSPHCEPPRTAGALRSQHPLSPCPSSKSDRQSTLQPYRSLPHLNQMEESEEVPDIYGDIKSTRSDLESEKSAHSLACSKKKLESKLEVRHRPGQIPSYLTERKRQWEEEKERQIKLREEASIPAGHTLLPDEERIETLELLKKNQDELIQSLAALPVRNDTIRLRNYKEELERQLAKVEEGIKIFSRPKVLIKNDT